MASKEEKAKKKKLKAQKKILKAQYELDKKRIEYKDPGKKKHWYRNPDWVRAIVAIITLIVTVLLIFFGLKG